ncbi:MAG: 50S ribosomal protein L17 [Spirochaetales bacterium]|uniref:Large ribosomal subunit protein bL17 n=1 Tax=Candidatus Thalassospirochaeta sargassi TaxID=3119039 RepID=A0AAJ1MPN9_9SPIO|nr:50S ribosomal protein L17 [Spirochaetales bacterium]
MHNRVGYNKLSRKTSHRRAMTRNMVTSLFRYERITTTKAKALEVRKTAEKMITRAKVDSVHNRRVVNKDIKDAEVLNKLFTEIGPVNANRPGGYTRILKTGLRKGDAAEMVILELILDEAEPKKAKKKTAAKKSAPKKAEPVKEEVVADETAAEEEPAVEVAAEEKVEEASVEESAPAPAEEAEEKKSE